MEQDRHGAHRVLGQLGAVELVLQEAGAAGHHRVDELEVARVRVEADRGLLAAEGFVDAAVAVVVFDVAGAAVRDRREGLHRGEPFGALELGEDRFDRATEVVGEDAEPAAVGHAEDDVVGAGAVGEGDRLVEHRHDHVEPLDREDLGPQIRFAEEALELEDVDQPVQQALFLIRRHRLAVGAGLDHLAQPDPLLVRGDVLELVADRRAVGVAHPRQRLQQRFAGDADPQDRGRDPRHQLRGQVQVLRLQAGVALRLRAERVEAGGEVALGPVGLQQRGRGLDRLQQLLVDLAGDARGFGGRRRGGERRGRGGGGVGVGDRRRLDAEVGGDLLVELVLALQQPLDPFQELARLGALDDAVVVGRGQRHDLRDAELLDPLRRGVRPLRRVGDRAGGDDRALAGEQPRHRGDGADPARVGEADVGAEEVVGGQLVLAGLRDQLFEAGVEAGEVEVLRALDRRDHQAVGAVLLGHVDGDAEVDRPVLDRVRLAVPLGEGADHHRGLFRRLDDRPGDQVGEGRLQAALLQLRVDRLAFRVEGVDGDRAEGGRGGDGAALVHRLGEHRGRPAQRLLLARGGSGGTVAGTVAAVEDVLFGDLAAEAAAGDAAEVDPLRFRHPPRNRRGFHI